MLIYDSLIKQMEEGILNPLDIDIKLFLKNLLKDKDIRNSVIFIKLSVQLLKLKVNNFLSLISTEGKEKKITKTRVERKIFETLKEETGVNEGILSLLMEESIKEKLRKPKFF